MYFIITSKYKGNPTYTSDKSGIGPKSWSTIDTGVRMIQLDPPQWRPQVMLDSLIQKKQ